MVLGSLRREFFSRKEFHNFLLSESIPTCGTLGDLSRRVGICVGRNRRQYRSRIQIAANILEIAKQGSRKTRIMYLGNLSFDLLRKYLDMLVKLNLIETRGDSERSYIATEKGRRFLEDFYELQKYSEMVDAKRRALESSLTATA